MKNPSRGEVWLVDLGIAGKIRPCLVVSIELEDQDRALVTILNHTTSPCGSRFEVDVETKFLKKGVFDVQNLATIPRAKFLRKLGTLRASELGLVEDALRGWLGLH